MAKAAVVMSSEAGFPNKCIPKSLPFSSESILQRPFLPSFSATNLPEKLMGSVVILNF